MRINGVRYSVKFFNRIQSMHKNFGTYIVGCYLAGCRIPARDAMCLLRMRSFA